MLNYNRAKIIIREKKAVNTMLTFFGEWTQEEREGTELALLSTDKIPKSVFNYYTKWSDFIAKDASCRCGFQISVSDITIQNLTEYFAHRGGKGNLGKKLSPEHRAKISEARTGKKRSATTRAKISEARTGKKHSAVTRAKISEARTGKKRPRLA
jgi:hypothetical protein